MLGSAMRALVKSLVPLAMLLASANAAAPDDADHQRMMDLLHITAPLRSGVNGWDAHAPNPVNYDETKVRSYSLPDPLRLQDGKPVTTAQMWWKKRRPELVGLFDSQMYGRVPSGTPRVHWQITGATMSDRWGVKAVTEQLIGHADNSRDPAIKVDIQSDLTLPAAVDHPVPVMIVLTWTGKWNGPPIPAGNDPDWREQLLKAGWGYAEYVPVSVQADNAAGLTQGIIGLMNKGGPRKLDDWGALRAWAWGVSRVVDYLQTDRRVDPHRIGVEGHSRYGKAALVAEAYDPRIAVGYISSSGAGGAKLLRRNYGEQIENLAGGESYWFDGNFIQYAGPKTVDDLPVDAHELIALCAPRPVFISAGTKEAGDGWVDAKGSFLAAVAAGPVYRLLGRKDLGSDQFPPQGTALIDGDLGFRQHQYGHTPQPNWKTFIAFAKRHFQAQ
jgi:(4-O-methyl)-D-glucuronate---lignin esterase